MAKAKPKTVSDKQPRKPRAKTVGKKVGIPTTTNEDIPTLQRVPLDPAQFPTDAAMSGEGSNPNKSGQQPDNSQNSTRTQPDNADPVSDGNQKGRAKEKDSQHDMGDASPFPTEAISNGRSQREDNAKRPAKAPLSAPTTGKTDMGDVASAVAESATEYGTASGNLPLARVRPGETWDVCWERLRKEGRAAGMRKGQGPGTAYEWATTEMYRLFPPPVDEPESSEVEPEPVQEELAIEPEPVEAEPIEDDPEAAPAPIPSDQGVSGLGTMPESWGILPANASLQVEISWVSANRLRVRDGTGVDLSKALSPAPSYSALSWLETSILFPSKFADISVKATANQDDEREAIRREKLSIEEIRGLLAEMLEG